MMNIDAQIRDILSRNHPVNDNNTPDSQSCKTQTTPVNDGIYIVGNNNIIISSGLLVAAMMTFFLSICLLFPH